jgi:membrane protease YdiL (CAAX protease family)
LTPQADGLYHTPASRGWGALAIQGLVGRIAINAAVGLTVVSTLAFFEEVGWRVWLLPRLAHRLGGRGAVVITSFIWAFWHIPFAFSGIRHLEGVTATRTAIIMAIRITGAGLVIGWLWLRTESIWIVSLAHGALNNWGQYAFKFIQTSVEHDASNALVLAAGNVMLLALGIFLLLLPNSLPLVPSSTNKSKARDGTAIQPGASADDSPRRG